LPQLLAQQNLQASFQAPATSASFPSRVAKASTGLVSDTFASYLFSCLSQNSFAFVATQVGYPVDPDARQNLITDYNRVLKYASSLRALLHFFESVLTVLELSHRFVDWLEQVHVEKHS
jgi:hypothetical protein